MGVNKSSMADDKVPLFLQKARKQYERSRQACQKNYREAMEDLEFKIGNQWPKEALESRRGRPMLTLNNQPQFVKTVANEWRQQRPGIKVKAVRDGTAQVAQVIAGYIRNVEQESDAEVIYDSVLEHAISAGFAYFRIGTDYIDDDGFEQDIIIKPIYDQFAVTPDCMAVKYYKEDANYYFIEEVIDRDEFKEKFPEASEGWGDNDYDTQGWADRNQVKVAEYYYIKPEKQKIVRMTDGNVIIKPRKGELDAYRDVNPGVDVDRERTAVRRAVKWCKVTAHDILEATDVPCDWIPIIPMYGDRTMIGRKEHLSGVIRHNKDMARIQNFMSSEAVGATALAPKRPPVLTTDQIRGHEKRWESWMTQNPAYLLINNTGQGDPRRLEADTSAMDILKLGLVFSDQMKETSGGINKATLGQQSNEKSGRAIRERKSQGQLATYNYPDNMNRAIKFAGRTIISMIPRVIDTERELAIMSEQGEVESVIVNDALEQLALNKGKYSITVEAGQSHATKRDEVVDVLTEIVEAAPEYRPALLPMIIRNVDMAGADQALQAIESINNQMMAGGPAPGAEAGPTG